MAEGSTVTPTNRAARRTGQMAAELCGHPRRTSGVVELDFSRILDRAVYSVEVSVGVCEQCGHVELHAKSHHALCDWLDRN